MTRSQVAFGCAVFVGAAVFLAVDHRGITRLKAENDALRQKVDLLAWLGTENQRLSNAMSQATGSLSGNALTELLKLRSEVGFLRKQTNALQTENRQLHAEVEASVPVASLQPSVQTYIPREEWAFAGYDTPEAGLQSVLWATSNGDLQTFLTSITPDMLEHIQQAGVATSNLMAAIAEESRNIKGYQIVKATALAEDQMLLNVSFGDDVRKVKLERTQGQWQLAEPINP